MNKQKKLLLVGAGLEQKVVINLAKKMGLKVIAVDGNPKAVGLKIADIGICEDIYNIANLINIGKKYNVDGVMTHAVDIPFVVAKVAQALGLPHLDPKAALRATDKIERIETFKKAGLPVAKFNQAKSYKEAEIKAQQIGFPLVVKPADNAGARGVKRINNINELKDGFIEALNFSKSKKVLLEQFLEGIEISTESFVYKGKIYTTGFADRNYSRSKEFEPYFVEDGHSVPSTLDNKTKQKVIKTVEKAIRALGIDWGVAKGDILISKGKIYVIEMAARTSGGWFAVGTVPLATGVNLLKPLIKVTVDGDLDENDFKIKYNRAACQRYVIPNKEGFFVKFDGINKARKMPGVKILQMFKKPKKGSYISKSTNNAERFGHLITVGKDVEDATRKCETAIKKIKIILI